MDEQEFINITLPFIQKKHHREVLRRLGYYHGSEFARLTGYTRQYISKAKDKFEYIVFDGREHFKLK